MVNFGQLLYICGEKRERLSGWGEKSKNGLCRKSTSNIKKKKNKKKAKNSLPIFGNRGPCRVNTL